MLDQPEAVQEPPARSQQRRPPRPKTAPFQKEYLQAQRRREEQEQRHKAFEEAKRQKQIKREQSENFRRQLDRARRPGRDGQRRLGRESKFLPGMVENLFKKLEEQKAPRINIET